ncbi:hypothetical protein [Streptomyces sp. NPDC048340]|uniref:hypothetical protein n=1 Tax=Streptomyces sp. NPDC048340 TaxID=3365537 RepID=UPI0037132CBA
MSQAETTEREAAQADGGTGALPVTGAAVTDTGADRMCYLMLGGAWLHAHRMASDGRWRAVAPDPQPLSRVFPEVTRRIPFGQRARISLMFHAETVTDKSLPDEGRWLSFAQPQAAGSQEMAHVLYNVDKRASTTRPPGWWPNAGELPVVGATVLPGGSSVLYATRSKVWIHTPGMPTPNPRVIANTPAGTTALCHDPVTGCVYFFDSAHTVRVAQLSGARHADYKLTAPAETPTHTIWPGHPYRAGTRPKTARPAFVTMYGNHHNAGLLPGLDLTSGEISREVREAFATQVLPLPEGERDVADPAEEMPEPQPDPQKAEAEGAETEEAEDYEGLDRAHHIGQAVPAAPPCPTGGARIGTVRVSTWHSVGMRSRNYVETNEVYYDTKSSGLKSRWLPVYTFQPPQLSAAACYGTVFHTLLQGERGSRDEPKLPLILKMEGRSVETGADAANGGFTTTLSYSPWDRSRYSIPQFVAQSFNGRSLYVNTRLGVVRLNTDAKTAALLKNTKQEPVKYGSCAVSREGILYGLNSTGIDVCVRDEDAQYRVVKTIPLPDSGGGTLWWSATGGHLVALTSPRRDRPTRVLVVDPAKEPAAALIRDVTPFEAGDGEIVKLPNGGLKGPNPGTLAEWNWLDPHGQYLYLPVKFGSVWSGSRDKRRCFLLVIDLAAGTVAGRYEQMGHTAGYGDPSFTWHWLDHRG